MKGLHLYMDALKITGFAIGLILLISASLHAAPVLPEQNGEVTLPAQEWSWQPGPREIKVYLFYPGNALARINAETGLILTLHNWGGTKTNGAPDPAELAAQFNLIGIGVDYVQSGPYDPAANPPYDYGVFQALDALRGLHFVYSELGRLEKSFAKGRIYATGGSGGGNVSLMANKLAPRTFAAIIDICGMAKLGDAIAFGRPEGTHLNAGYSSDPASPRYLAPDAQELRFIGHPEHLAVMKQLGNTARVYIVHGTEDESCPVADKKEMAKNMQAAGLDVEPHFITSTDLDGEAVKNTGHSLGNRTKIVSRFASACLQPGGSSGCVRGASNDFELRDEKVAYPVTGGRYVVSYAEGYPILRFEKAL